MTNSLEAAFQAASNWLGEQAVSSVERFDVFRSAGNPMTLHKNQAERVAQTVKGAIVAEKNYRGNCGAKAFAEAIIDSLSAEDARELCQATNDAYAMKFGTASNDRRPEQTT